MTATTFVKQASVCTVTAFAILSACGIGPANAAIINFDDLNTGGSYTLIPNGYQGFNWNNFYAISQSYSPQSGYGKGTASAPNVAFNGFGDPASFSPVSGTFDFNSAYLTAAWSDGLNILVEGFLGGVNTYSQTVVVNTTSPTKFTFNYLGVETVRFTSFGGTDSYRSHLALDTLEYNATSAVPEPLTILGATTAIALGAGFKRKLAQSKKLKKDT